MQIGNDVKRKKTHIVTSIFETDLAEGHRLDIKCSCSLFGTESSLISMTVHIIMQTPGIKQYSTRTIHAQQAQTN